MDEDGSVLRDDGVACASKERRADTPASCQLVGKPISQRENRGFSWNAAVFAVSAEDEAGVSPENCWLKGIPVSCGLGGNDPLSPSVAVGLTYPVIVFTITWRLVIAVLFAFDPSRCPIRVFIARCASGDLLSSFATGVGQPVEPLSDMGSADAVCAQYDRPAGVAFGLQVCRYSIEPAFANRVCNLLAKDCESPWLAEVPTIADEVEEDGPEVALVVFSEAFAGGAEWLAGAGAGAHRSSCWPACELQSEAPAADAGEEVALGVVLEVSG